MDERRGDGDRRHRGKGGARRGAVVLVFPPVTAADRSAHAYHSLPMGLLVVGTVLEERGFESRFVDCSFEADYVRRVVEAALAPDCLYVGMSVMSSQVRFALELSSAIKRARPSLPVVWGGFHPTLFPEQTAAHSAVDVSVIDEGERAAADLAEAFAEGGELSGVRGIAYSTRDGVVRTEEGTRLDFGGLPPLRYEIVEPERYIRQPVSRFGPEHGPARSLPLLTGLGCRFRCAFCMNALLRRPYRVKPANAIVVESRGLVERYGIEDFTFVDEHFFGDEARVREFVELKAASGLTFTWDTNARASDFRPGRLNDALLARLRRSGLTRLGIGAESGSQRVLDMIRKGVKVDEVKGAARALHAAGISGAFSFMVGLPGEHPVEYDATFRLCSELLSISPRSTIIGPQLFRPYPGSELYRTAVSRYGLEEPSDLEGWARRASAEEGYFSADTLPWVTRPRALAVRAFYLTRCAASARRRSVVGRIVVEAARRLSAMRLRRGFYRLPVEYRLYLAFRPVWRRRKARSSVRHLAGMPASPGAEQRRGAG